MNPEHRSGILAVEKEEKRMRYELTEWEANGYHDSDFYKTYWDDEEGTVGNAMVGTTRGVMTNPPKFEEPTPEVVEKAVEWLAGVLAKSAILGATRDAEEPSNANKGDTLELLHDVTFTDKKRGTETTALAGEVGTVIWSGAFGKFYGNGWNRPHRGNIRVGLKFDDGRVIFTGLKSCRRATEVDEAALTLAAAERAKSCCFTKFFGGAWDTTNKAAAVLAAKEA